jgi:hypothetical protein
MNEPEVESETDVWSSPPPPPRCPMPDLRVGHVTINGHELNCAIFGDAGRCDCGYEPELDHWDCRGNDCDCWECCGVPDDD